MTLLLALAIGPVGGLALPAPVSEAEGEPQAGPNTPVTAHALQRARNSPQLAADPTDRSLVALASRLDAPDFGCALHLSSDGGDSWGPVEPLPELPAGAEKCYAPEVAFDADGTLYYLFVGLHGKGNRPMGAFLVTSDDGGRTFSSPRQVLGPRRFQVRLAIDRELGDDGRLHLVWLRPTSKPPLGGLPVPPNPIMAAHSDDGGHTWSEPVQVSDADRERVVAPAVAVGADHAVHVAYYDLEGDARDFRGQEGPVWQGTWSVVSATSRDGGGSFEEGVVVDDGLVPAERVLLILTMPPPALAADEAGRVAIGWDDARHGDRDVLVARSADAGATWDGPVRAHDDATDNGAAQYLPQLAFASDGRLDAVFYDRRHDPANRHAHLTYTNSSDGGATFAGTTRVTSEATDSTNGQTYPASPAEGQVEFGSRLGLLAGEQRAVAAWADTRNALTNPQQAIFAAPVVLSAEGDGGGSGLPAAGVPVGAALAAVVLLAVLVVGWRRPRAVAAANRTAIAAGRCTAIAAHRLPAGLRWAVVAAGVLAVVAAVWTPTTPARPTSTALRATVADGTLTLARDTVPAGRVVVRAQHAGEAAHEVVLLPLPADMDESLDQALRSDAERAVTVLADLPTREAGEETVFALDLPPGRYGLVCFEEGPGDETHAAVGENAEFTVELR